MSIPRDLKEPLRFLGRATRTRDVRGLERGVREAELQIPKRRIIV